MTRQHLRGWSRDQLADEVVKLRREQNEGAQHRAAIKRDLELAQALQWTGVRELDAQLGGPVIRELMAVVHAIIEAADPLSSNPQEDVMRVSNPSSSRDEGAPTRRYRNLKRVAVQRIDRVTNSLRADLERDDIAVNHGFINRQNALKRWHGMGKHDEASIEDCPDCD